MRIPRRKCQKKYHYCASFLNHLRARADPVYALCMYGILFDPNSRLSQYRQLVDQLRGKITSGLIPGGSRLASTRELAESLGIARGIVLEAIEQLKMEGYLETAHGSGTYVRPDLVWNGGTAASSHGNGLDPLAGPSKEALLSFAPGMPDLSLFPRRQWLQCYHDAVEYASIDDLGYNRPSGRWDLRVAIARYLHEVKGIVAGPERIVVTAGSSQAFAILASLFPRARVLMENPQAPFVRRIFDGLGCEISYADVDEEGIVPERVPDEPMDLLYVTPAHQFPLGGTLSAERRVSLLRKARAIGAWIVEDDFDGELRYDGHPVAPLQSMAPERVVYVGTFSKTLSPALRVGYLVMPPGIQAKVKTAKRRWDLWNEGLQQKAMALFLSRGHLERHLRKCHRVYRAKNLYLRALVEERLGPRWRVVGATTGMHLVIRRSDGTGAPVVATDVAQALRARGIEVELVSEYCVGACGLDDAVIVAYANRTEEELARLVDEIKIADGAAKSASPTRPHR